ncbi:YceD family protein [Anaeropeptidivorans aminofermentans]|jgi:uncharacterized protein|uniref:YceD family protein n=1 Tax=Anaeropeptidivorans aminofermentans TaxID=2934315 RepID=UPI002023DB12|nr:DUF177 domain-containing protein [Anaeropeptidivorans aminofermentans]
MVVALELLKGSDKIDIEGRENVELSSLYNLDSSIAEIIIKGSIEKDGPDYLVKAHVDAHINFKCDTCLASSPKVVSFDMEERFSKTLAAYDEDSEIWPIPEDFIDLSSVTMENLYMNMPMKVSCSDGCKGLCPKCGKDLNQGDCDCDKTDIDPRFDVLRSLFRDKEV